MQIDATDPDTKGEYTDGLIVFDDTDGVFVQYLHRFFLKVDTHSSRIMGVTE